MHACHALRVAPRNLSADGLKITLLRQKALWLATGRILRHSKGAMVGQDGVLGFRRHSKGAMADKSQGSAKMPRGFLRRRGYAGQVPRGASLLH